MTTLEKDIERQLRKMVKSHGGQCLKWVCPGVSGVPDRIVLLPGGRVIFVELKKPKGGVLAPIQKHWAKKLVDLGFNHWVIWDTEDLANFNEVELEPVDPREPLDHKPNETDAEFIARLMERLKKGNITANAARLSVGLEPIKTEGDGIGCATCRHSHTKPDGECRVCKHFNRWRPIK